jgi:probable phosphoglycerate mutase
LQPISLWLKVREREAFGTTETSFPVAGETGGLGLRPSSPQFFSFFRHRWQDLNTQSLPSGVPRFAQDNPDRDVAIVSHGSVIRALLNFYCRKSVTDINSTGHSDNTAVSLVEVEGSLPIVIYKNDNSHLSPELSTIERQNWWKENSSPAEISMWFKSADMAAEGRRYVSFREDAWNVVYGDLEGFTGEGFLKEARAASRENPRAVVYGMLMDDIAGIIELNTKKGEDEGVGYIPFYYLKEEYRGRGLAVQLLGQAVSFYRRLGRKYLKLRVSPDNKRAISFYEKNDFIRCGFCSGPNSNLILMKKAI